MGRPSGPALVAAGVLALWAFATRSGTAADAETGRRVGLEELVAAMELQRGFDISATTNGSRFQGGVILQLARRALASDPNGPPLFIDHRDSFAAFLRVAHLTTERAPAFVRLPFEYGQDQVIEYRRDRVIERVDSGQRIDLAVSVKASWPDNLPGSFSYLDTYSTPNLSVTCQRLVSYKLVDFGDFILYDEISGVSGRPTTGMLGLFFKIIGDSQVVQSRSAVSSDGLQVAVAHVRKGFIRRTAIATIQPGGKAEQDVDPGRPDLREIENRLKQEIHIRYR